MIILQRQDDALHDIDSAAATIIGAENMQRPPPLLYQSVWAKKNVQCGWHYFYEFLARNINSVIVGYFASGGYDTAGGDIFPNYE
ncbi:hypothetical protein [Azospirillum sp. TSO22-1]|uniref:hypothetical protein n=1 Tax=Azospirillum sp. TSO22-1 TaxID=716789 RepID=UPI0011B6B161|nr:hypothetical protein [Azospirillum sp. TSO22-1]